MTTSDNRQQLIAKLKELFQMDQADLDFGIYRIMNTKRDEITRFLEQDLMPTLRSTLEKFQPAGQAEKQAALEEAIKAAHTAGFDPEQSPKVQQLRTELSQSVDLETEEETIYSDLTTFFSRYYQGGDFMSLRRYKEGVYALPYEGEEVKLHWANADQYYIKTAENFTRYAFKTPQGRVRFELIAASTERDNVKASAENERRFILAEHPLAEENGELVIYFEFRPDPDKRKQKKLNTLAVSSLLALPVGAPLTQGILQWAGWQQGLATIADPEKNKSRCLLEKHLSDYTAKNTFDYFIHKDLGKFLRRELDFFIKNEVMHLDDIEDETAPKVEQYLARIKAMRQIAHKIIAFLAQLENFQKKLWLKKKFVLETQWLITLDRIDESFYPEICEQAEKPVRAWDGKTRSQREEWVELFGINRPSIAPPDENSESPLNQQSLSYSIPLTPSFLKSHPSLVLDTAYFTDELKYRLLAEFENLDEKTSGLLVHGENFQGLNLLRDCYRERVRCIYIDPPYNTGGDGFPYKDGYQHSSWASLIFDRISLASDFLKKEGAIFASIDENEFSMLRQIMGNIFGEQNLLAEFTWLSEGNFDNQAKIKIGHEYVIAFAKSESDFPFPSVIDPSISGQSKLFNKEIRNTIIKNGPKNPVSTINLPLGFPADFEQGVIYSSSTSWPKYSMDVSVNNHQLTNEVKAESGWSSKSLIEDFINNGMCPINDSKGQLTRFVITKSGAIESIKERSSNHGYVTSIIKSVGTIQSTSAMLEHMGVPYPHYPKPVQFISYITSIAEENDGIVLDFFAGSGTTAHAVVEASKTKKTNRKFICIEQGDVFDTVIKPRICKVAYSSEWKKSKPEKIDGVSLLTKYIRIESYEDACDNLTLARTKDQQNLLNAAPGLREGYFLNYMLDIESRQQLLDFGKFADPFSIEMSIVRHDDAKKIKVDVIETFNYLLGLRIETLRRIKGIHEVIGTMPNGDRTLILWRNTQETNNDALDEWFRKQAYNSRDREFDLIYVNGDNNLENLRRPDESWKVRLIEEAFQTLMFDVVDV